MGQWSCRSREGAWIEIPTGGIYTYDTEVAPVRERGLKLWIKALLKLMPSCRSREGAWIEIVIQAASAKELKVAPVRERGLK